MVSRKNEVKTELVKLNLILVYSSVCSSDTETELPLARGTLHSTAEKRCTPVLLSASVSNIFGKSPQMAAPRRSYEIDQSTQRFHVGCDNRWLLGTEYGGLQFLGRTLILTG